MDTLGRKIRSSVADHAKEMNDIRRQRKCDNIIAKYSRKKKTGMKKILKNLDLSYRNLKVSEMKDAMGNFLRKNPVMLDFFDDFTFEWSGLPDPKEEKMIRAMIRGASADPSDGTAPSEGKKRARADSGSSGKISRTIDEIESPREPRQKV